MLYTVSEKQRRSTQNFHLRRRAHIDTTYEVGLIPGRFYRNGRHNTGIQEMTNYTMRDQKS